MESVKLPSAGRRKPTEGEIRRQLERIFASSEFHSPRRGRAFLQFIVNEALEGRSQFLKAFTIANVVFGREASFDAQNDPVVRIEAGRIRRALERYYLVAGHGDGVVITIPKGGYVPSFDYAEDHDIADITQAHPATEPDLPPAPPEPTVHPKDSDRSWARLVLPAGAALLAVAAVFSLGPLLASRSAGPSSTPTTGAAEPKVVVEPFRNATGTADAADLASGLRDEVIGQLVKFKDIVVVASQPAVNGGLVGDEPRYALQGSVRLEDNKFRSIVRLVRRNDGAVIWANNYDSDLRAQGILQIQEGVAQQVASAVAQPYGAIFETDASAIAREPTNNKTDTYACTLAYYSYRASMSPRSHEAARECLQQATKHNPNDATYWALLSMTYLDELRFRYKLGVPSPSSSLKLASEAAQRATSIDAHNARALQALMLVSFFGDDIDTALRAGAAAYSANPNDAEVAGEYGLRLSMSGKWLSGCELVSSAVNRSAGPKGYYEVGMALCAFMRGDIQVAELWSRMSDLEYNPMHHLVLLSILGAAGKLDESKKEQDWLRANAPALMDNIRTEVSMRLQRPEDQERFFAGLKASGTAVASPNSRASSE